MKIDSKQLYKYLEEYKKTLSECPLCKNIKWGLEEAVFSLNSRNKKISMPLLIAECNECGYVFLRNQIILDKIMEENNE